MLRRHAVVSPEQPCIKVPERDMDHREVLVCLRVIPTGGNSIMVVALFGKRFVSDPRIGSHFCTYLNIRTHEGYQRLLLPIRVGVKSLIDLPLTVNESSKIEAQD